MTDGELSKLRLVINVNILSSRSLSLASRQSLGATSETKGSILGRAVFSSFSGTRKSDGRRRKGASGSQKEEKGGEEEESVASAARQKTCNKEDPWWYLTDDQKTDFLRRLRTEWTLGNPLPELTPGATFLERLKPGCPEVVRAHRSRRDSLEGVLTDLGDSGRNQLATPMEYESQVKMVVKRIEHMFSDMDEDSFGMSFFSCGVSLYYDPSYWENSVVAEIFFVFLGTELPKENVWKTVLKIHQHMTTVDEMDASFYFPVNGNLLDRIPKEYRLSDNLLRDEELAKHFGTSKEVLSSDLSSSSETKGPKRDFLKTYDEADALK